MIALPTVNPRLLYRGAFISSIRRGISSRMGSKRSIYSHADDSEMKDLMDYIDSLKNYEKSGVPKGAGTDSREGFDLGRMTRLMERFGNPQSKFKVGPLTSNFFSFFKA